MILVRQVLQGKPPGVWTISPQATVYEALELMAEKNIGALPVVENGKLAGMFSERDYARKVILMGKSSRSTLVGELMSHPVFSVKPDDTIERCMELMSVRHIRHLPVLQGDQLIGIVSSRDVLGAIIDDQRAFIRDLENYITGTRG